MTDTKQKKLKPLTFIIALILVCILWLLVLPHKTAEEIWQENILDLEQKKAEASGRIEELKEDYKLLLGIMYAESHIGANFKPYKCKITNNRAWLKGRKYDDWTTSERYNVQYQSLDLDLEWCWLYYFEDYKQFFESLANTISIGYGKCNEDVYCIMKSYVWHESGAWVRNVYLFKSL